MPQDKRITTPQHPIPRPEHPRPEAYRESWLNLNGEWELLIDREGTQAVSELLGTALPSRILVPFCPESRLSGIGDTDFMRAVFYHRQVRVPAALLGRRLLLHLEACDYRTEVYVNGQAVGQHVGGYTPMAFDITDALQGDIADILIRAEDDTTSPRQCSGKQSERRESYGCMYTRTTGIWQTVWLEAVDAARIERYTVRADAESELAFVTVHLTAPAIGTQLTVSASYEGRQVGTATARVLSREVTLALPLSELHLWEMGAGRLYDLTLSLSREGAVCDRLCGYFGRRSIALRRDGMYLNGKRTFGRFVLDQGFYPDGIYTAPTEEALAEDIRLSMAMGFNGARLHERVFEPRYLYHADKMGYLVFDEYANWGFDHTVDDYLGIFLAEWREVMVRDMSHPSIIGWCPFNETWEREGRLQSNSMLAAVYEATRAMDTSRIVIGTSGSLPAPGDAHDSHDYEQDPAIFADNYSRIQQGVVNDCIARMHPTLQVYDPTRPVFVSEYGGIGWAVGEDGWGYGKSVADEQEFFARLEGLTRVLLDNPDIFAFCYTQLYDVEQEQNGLLTYTREPKFPLERLRRVFTMPAVCEDGTQL